MAVIIDAYEKLQEMVDWKLSPQHLDEFVWAWAEFDDGSGTISPEGFLLVSVESQRIPEGSMYRQSSHPWGCSLSLPSLIFCLVTPLYPIGPNVMDDLSCLPICQ